MPNAAELLKRRAKIDEALHGLIQQGEVVPAEERDHLGQKYNELWADREALNAEIKKVAPTVPAVRAAAPAAAGAPRRRIRWGVLAVGGAGVVALLGLVGWQLYRVHGKRKTRRKKKRR